MAFTIKELFQIQAALYTIVLVGFILAMFKVFVPQEIWPLYEVVRLSCFAAMMFNLIGNTKYSMANWKPFFPIFISQLIIHLAILAAAFIKKAESRVLTYIQYVTSFCFQECTIFIYQILDVIYPKQYNVIAIMFLLAEEFIYIPILKILLFVLNGPEEEEEDSDAVKKVPSDEDDELPEQDGVEGVEGEPDEISKDGNPNEIKDDQPSVPDPEDVRPESTEKKTTTLKKTIIFAWVNPNTICTILGFIWAGIGVKMPDLMTNFITDLSKCVSGSMIFGIGAMVGGINMWRWHNFIPIVLCVNYVILPLLIIGFCRLFKVTTEQSRCVVLMSVSPTSLIALHQLPDSDDMIGPRIAFMWSALLWLPFQFIWGDILLYTSIV
ncbi:Auxin Efflux Carrier family protein [Trichomonas vaginalis G3]|uniref:Auxin Efflux Carrier family protein n=1 Tax=Trichomonas vaginalis (strain ATCC PRA-98 / G3) TaxID=412133 RepID=A2EJX2_TRIV3|nr:auxin efflux carrier component 1B-related family [Trichomonas vaginalis G3]EAY07040.1 Auxin Efflux Carrier family protein [Trichomonas vaginalis G3]KAI5529564.1 auxin efflux carrier component 1B-related family [Trichomonas vaginalis G3]|eukprot:XP_001319263.1 Auxin Efflux Carrier family protein [Trichomonas vaginalis G3]